MYKKIIALLLVMCAVLVAGCGKTATLEELTEEQLSVFEQVSIVTVRDYLDVKNEMVTVDVLNAEQNAELEQYIKDRTMPKNAVELFEQWKQQNNWDAFSHNMDETTSLIIPKEHMENPIAMEDLTQGQLSSLKMFTQVSADDFLRVQSGETTVEKLDLEYVKMIDMLIFVGDLPENAQYLIQELKENNGYYETFENIDQKEVVNGEIVYKTKKPAQQQEKLENPAPIVQNQNKPTPTEKQDSQQGTVVTPQQNKPQPSESQQQTQIEDVQSKPLNPSQNIEEEGEYTGYGTIVDADDVLGSGGYDRALVSEANRIAKQQGISFEEAVAQVEKAWGY